MTTISNAELAQAIRIALQRERRKKAMAKARLRGAEQSVVRLLRARLAAGAEQYGALDVVNDDRDWTREALEEVLDLCIYLACEILRRTPPQKRTQTRKRPAPDVSSTAQSVIADTESSNRQHPPAATPKAVP